MTNSRTQMLLILLIGLTTTAPYLSGQTPAGFVVCANENQTCNAATPIDVAYGAGGAFFVKTDVLGFIACNNKTFGDPAVGTVKACYASPRYALCAVENQTCSGNGVRDIAYAANGAVHFKFGVTGDIPCNNATFGDPAPYFAKACYSSAAFIQPVWGFADLHTHPAGHLAFGADSTGHNGVIWGIPMSFDGADSVATDLPTCNPMTHDSSVGTFDMVAQGIHLQILQALNDLTGFNSTDFPPGNPMGLPSPQAGYGSPTFATWPDARSITHQQMHISSMRRAFDGGLRLMIADAADTQLISRLWRYQGESDISPVITPSSGFDTAAAITQLQYIHQLAAANANWMQVVKTPTEARDAIAHNRLAIILGVEMDSLFPQDIDTLYRTQDVRHVIPIHLANNDFGAPAAYSDVFASNSHWLNSPFEYNAWQPVAWDSCVNFQYTAKNLNTITTSSIAGALRHPDLVPMDAQTYQSLNYAPPSSCGPDQPNGFHHCGVLNPGAANSADLLQVMQHPFLLLDVVHMSQAASAATLSLAEQYNYPVMDSHTGIRDNDPSTCLVNKGSALEQIDERSLPWSQAQRIARLGGVIGLGTARDPFGDRSKDPVGEWFTDYTKLQSLGFTNGKGIALGTDTNGLSPQIPFDNTPLTYPITISPSFGPPAGVPTPALCKYSPSGVTTEPPCNYPANLVTYDFASKGIAVYGMLPDFLAAVNKRAVAASTDIRAMFHTAEDVIEMWERVAAASTDIPCGAGNKCCGNNASGFCTGKCVPVASSCPGPPPAPCPSGQKCCGGDDGAGHCLGACISATDTCTSTNVCPGAQHCCTGISSTGVCIGGCIANNLGCKPLCSNGGNNCCGDRLPNGACQSACIKSPPAACP